MFSSTPSNYTGSVYNTRSGLYPTLSLTYNKSGTTSGKGVTSQYDRKQIYRKRRMPRRKRRAWKRFTKKVVAAQLKTIGTRTILKNDTLSRTYTGDTQSVVSFCLFGKDGGGPTTSACGFNDLASIFQNDAAIANRTSKIQLFSGVLDITMTNLSEVLDNSTQNTSLEVDLYELVATKQIDAAYLSDIYLSADSNTDQINVANPGISINNRGATPFELTDFTGRGIKILKKTKYFLGAGQVATYQYRDAKNFRIRNDNIDDANSDFALPYKTRIFMIIIKGVPTPDANQVNKKLLVGVTRKYGYKIFDKNNDADNILP